MLVMTQAIVPGSRSKRGSLWRCEAFGFAAESRNGAPQALARILVDAWIADQPVEVVTEGLKGVTRYRSLHAMAGRTIKESDMQSLRSAKWQPRPDNIDAAPAPQAENRGERGGAASTLPAST